VASPVAALPIDPDDAVREPGIAMRPLSTAADGEPPLDGLTRGRVVVALLVEDTDDQATAVGDHVGEQARHQIALAAPRDMLEAR
jgi:hypothetical protein